MINISDKVCRENQNTHFMFQSFFTNIMLFMRLLKNVVQPEAMDDNMPHVLCMLGKATHAPTHTFRHTETCNTYCFSTATAAP
jgi:hypothetical protein